MVSLKGRNLQHQPEQPGWAVIIDGQGVGTIVDDGRTLPPGVPANDDRPVFNMGSDFIVDEAAGTVTFTVTKTGATDLVSTVDFGTVNGSAVAGSDYTANKWDVDLCCGRDKQDDHGFDHQRHDL